MWGWGPRGHLSGAEVVTVGVGAAVASTLQLTVVDLYTHFTVAGPSFHAHARHTPWASVHTLGLHKRGRAAETWTGGCGPGFEPHRGAPRTTPVDPLL